MDSITVTALGELCGGIALEALRPLLTRAAFAAARVSGRHRPQFYEAYAAQLGANIQAPSLLSLYRVLPTGITLKAVSDALKSPIALGLIRQLTAFNIIGYEGSVSDRDLREASLEKLHRNFVDYMYEAMNVSYSTPNDDSDAEYANAPTFIPVEHFVSFVGAVINVLNTYSQIAADELTGSAQNTNYAISWAHEVLAYAVLDSVARYTAISAGESAPRLAERNRWLDSYRQVFIACHQKIQLPDLDTRRTIHYKKLYVQPSFNTEGRTKISLDALLSGLDRAVVLGDPGAGKSTLSHVVGLTFAQRRSSVPFHLLMRDIDLSPTGFSVLAEIEERLRSIYQLEPLPNLLEILLLEGSAALIFDGLDELIDPTMRKRAAEVIEAVATRYPLTPILVTCRYVGYSQARLNPDVFATLSIEPLSVSAVEEYVAKWFSVSDEIMSAEGNASFSGQEGDEARRVADFIATTTSISDMRSNPLLLSFLCVLYRGRKSIPKNRPQLFERCIDLLLRAWDSARGVAVGAADDTTYELALTEVAAYIAGQHAGQNRGVPERTLVGIFAHHLINDAGYDNVVALTSASAMVQHCKGRAWIFSDAGLNDEGVSLYSFTHASFHEYFHAWSLSRRSPSPEALATELYILLNDGRSQIAVQVAIHFCEVRVTNGGSRCIAGLLKSLNSPGDDNAQKRSMLDVIFDSADAVHIQRSTLSALCLALLLQMVGPIGRRGADILQLLSPDFRHFSGVPYVLTDVFAFLLKHGDDRSKLRTYWLVTHLSLYVPDGMPWTSVITSISALVESDTAFDEVVRRQMKASDLAWQLALRKGMLKLSAFADDDVMKIFVRMFEPCADSVSIDGDSRTATWLLRVLADRRHSDKSIPQVSRLLRWLGERVSAESLRNISFPEVWTDDLRLQLIEMLQGKVIADALARCAAADHAVRLGIGYVCVACLDVFKELLPSEKARLSFDYYEGAFQQAYQMLLAGSRRVSPEFQRYLAEWSPGQIWVAEWSVGPEA